MFTSTDVQFSTQNQVKTKKAGLHVRRRPILRAKSGEDQKKGLHVRRLRFSAQNQVKRAS